MSDIKVGNCLELYLRNLPLLGSLEDEEASASELTEEQKLIATFQERASDQAVALLEDVHGRLLGGTASAVPYRTDRKTQRRTVREYWYVEGRLYRTRERIARTYWALHLGALKDRGPVLALILGPQDTGPTVAIDELLPDVAKHLGAESANPRSAFTINEGYETGIIAGLALLAPEKNGEQVSREIKESVMSFFSQFRGRFEHALDAEG